MTPTEFINFLKPKVKNLNVLPSLVIAQICLESAYGKRHFFNNYLGIKCHAGVSCRLAKTKEVIDGNYQDMRLAFAVYDSIDDCISDYNRIMGLPRYERVRKAKNYIEATQAIKDCGYATSLSYVNSLRKIIEQYKLYELDNNMNDMQLTANFKISEFACLGQLPPEQYLDNIKKVAIELQKLREAIGKPIRINSGWRTIAHNQAIGGATNSRHLTGEAADVKVLGFSGERLAIFAARYTNFNGFGVGANYCHLDIRPVLTIWAY